MSHFFPNNFEIKHILRKIKKKVKSSFIFFGFSTVHLGMNDKIKNKY